MSTHLVQRNPRILILNPNSSHQMTEGMGEAIKSLKGPLDIYVYTAPMESPSSINDNEDLTSSTNVVMADIISDPTISTYDGIIVACYSVHPLVKQLSSHFKGRVLVTGIFESSILTSLALISPYLSAHSDSQAWGIVTTGKFWEDHLSDGVRTYLGQDTMSPMSKFAGVYSTGLNAGDFHGDVPQDVIRDKLKDAARRLMSSAAVGCVVMGCAGMAGLERMIRSAAVEEYGEERAERLCIIDGVKAAITLMDQTIESKRMFQSADNAKH